MIGCEDSGEDSSISLFINVFRALPDNVVPSAYSVQICRSWRPPPCCWGVIVRWFFSPFQLSFRCVPSYTINVIEAAMASIIYTDDHAAGPIARLVLGAAILPHGLQKTLAWFGGQGLLPSLEALDGSGIPYALGALVIAAESLGAFALIFGIFGRFMAAAIILVMLGAIFTKHAAHGFFMNWNGLQEGEGFEYHLLAMGLGLIILILGSGSLSFDRWLTRRYWA